MTGKSSLHHPITAAEKATFADDGVVCLRQHFDADWVARLQAAADQILADPRLTLDYTAAGQPGRYVSSLFMWRGHPVFRDFVTNSSAAAIAGELMESTKINLFFDHLLIKEPGTRDPTRWHHDLPFWPLNGRQVCSIWLALDPVMRETGAIEYVAGSHKWPVRFRPSLLYTSELARKRNMDLPDCPSFHEQHGNYRLLSWDLAPGDCLVFHALTIHGSGGNSSLRIRRRGFATRWCGNDVTYDAGDFILAPPEPPGLTTGDPLDSDLFPVVWRRA